MVDEWLVKAMAAYNADSFENRDGYRGLVHMPGECLEQIVLWSLESLPDEILVGLDVDQKRPHIAEVDEMYQGVEHETDMFAGEGFVLTDATIVNRGDSFSVHHVPEEWTDGIFTNTRGPSGGRGEAGRQAGRRMAAVVERGGQVAAQIVRSMRALPPGPAQLYALGNCRSGESRAASSNESPEDLAITRLIATLSV